jgi:23S rRNA pseudouridine1911/1915/1917 synthase
MKEKDTVLQRYKATEESDLLQFLINQKVRKSRNAIKSLLSHKQVRVNGNIITQFNHPLTIGDVITIHKSSNAFDVKDLGEIKVIYEDEFLVVVHKEPKLLSIGTSKEKTETAYNIVNKYLRIKNPDARAYVLHRLDRDISGLMIYAKSEGLQKTIQSNWNEYILSHMYVVVVEGRPSPKNGTITSWLTEDKNYIMHSSETDNGGLKAVTHYTTLAANRRYTMLSVDAETRLKNQIRVQMQQLAYPVVGDKKYGSKINPIKRVALHSYELKFMHPITKEILDIKDPIPEMIQKLIVNQEKG